MKMSHAGQTRRMIAAGTSGNPAINRKHCLMKKPCSARWHTYVDLNPVRVGMADTPENSDYTSIKLRIDYYKKKSNHTDNMQPVSLMPFAGSLRQPEPRGLIFNLADYIELVDWTGRIIRNDKRGAISESAPPILQRLDISTRHWIELSTRFEQRFKGVAGTTQSIKALCAHFGLTRTVNRSNSQLLYG